MIMWIGSAEDRIISWRKYRQSLDELTLPQAITDLKKVWSHCPCLNQLSIDQTNPTCWPDPWQLMTNGAFCPLTQMLGVFYTISLTSHNHHNISLEMFDAEMTQQFQISIDQGKYIINLRNKKSINTAAQNNLQRYFWDTKIFFQ